MPSRPGKGPLGTGVLHVLHEVPGVNALGFGSFELLSSSATPARKQAFNLWGL